MTFYAFAECLLAFALSIIKLSQLFSKIFYTIKVMTFLGEQHKDFYGHREKFLKLELIMWKRRKVDGNFRAKLSSSAEQQKG
jgi:hypothetical protein